jgi:ComF family protein
VRSVVKEMLEGFISMIFPEFCAGCSTDLVSGEKLICTNCIYLLPRTTNHLEKENLLTRKFWGKVQIEFGMAFLKYSKKGLVQHLLQHIKYKGGSELSYLLGKWYGEDLKQGFAEEFDLIVPVPLHKNKLKLRGYNQSEYFANGLGEALQIPVDPDTVIRTVATSTQTRKKRYDRWLNVEGIFFIAAPEQLKHKHILLVDDVITTGSTLEACIIGLKNVEGVKVSVATIAVA